jgi:hypothetical protein
LTEEKLFTNSSTKYMHSVFSELENDTLNQAELNEIKINENK